MTCKTNFIKSNSIFSAALAGVAMSACGLFAQVSEDTSDDAILDLDTYTIAANRMEVELGKVGASITLLERAELEKFESTLAAEAIRFVPGIYVRNNGGYGSTSGITMRGLPVVPLVLIDGVEVNNPATGTAFNFGNLPSVAIERIEVVRGAQSSLYGANALTGVISVESRKPVSEGILVNLGASYGSQNTVSGYISASGKESFFDYSVAASSFSTDGYSVQPKSLGPEWEDDDGHELNSIHSRFNFEISEKVDATLILHYHDSEAEYDPGLPSIWLTPIDDNYRSEEQQLLKAQVDVEVIEGWITSASFTYNELDDFAQDSYGASSGESRLRKFDIISRYSPSEQYKGLLGLETEEAADGIGNVSYETTSVFTEHVFDVTEDLAFTAGARVDDNDTYGSESTWRTSFAYTINDSGWKLHGSYGTGFDAPEVAQLFGAWGNPDLVAENGSSFDLGIEWNSADGSVSAGVNYYDVDIEDKIEYLRSTFSYANVNWVSTGIEAFVQASLTEDTHFYASYSYADAKRERVADDLILESPEGIWSFAIDQEFLEDALQIRVTGRNVSERESWNGPSDAFFVLGVAASYRINSQIKVWLRADNLLDEEYQEILNYNSPPQAFSIGLNYEL